jgi:hypothetical protein
VRGAVGPLDSTGSREAEVDGFEDIEDAFGGIEFCGEFSRERELLFSYLSSIFPISSKLPLVG